MISLDSPALTVPLSLSVAKFAQQTAGILVEDLALSSADTATLDYRSPERKRFVPAYCLYPPVPT